MAKSTTKWWKIAVILLVFFIGFMIFAEPTKPEEREFRKNPAPEFSGSTAPRILRLDEVRNQLYFPLDPSSKKVISDLVTYPVTFRLSTTSASSAALYGVFFTALQPMVIVGATEVHGTAASTTSTLQLEKLSGTVSIDSGNNILKTALNLAGTANTVQYGEFGTAEVTVLGRGDRLAAKTSGALTSLQDVQITAYLKYA